MEKDINISVIIPSYNCKKTISESINSIINQSFAAHEIIVVDDGSTDNSFDYIKMMFPGVRLYKQENKGPASARNFGISVARGNWIAFLDSDDKLCYNALEAYNKLVKNDPSLNWIAGAYVKEFNYKNILILYEGKELRNGIIENVFNAYQDFKHKVTDELITTCSVLIKKKVFENVGKFNEQLFFGEDLDLWFRISLKYPKIGYIKSPVFTYNKIDITSNYNYRSNELARIKKSWSSTNFFDNERKNDASKILNIWVYRELKCIIRLREFSKINFISTEYLNFKNRIIYYSIRLLFPFR